MNKLRILPCLDSGEAVSGGLTPRDVAAELGRTALEASLEGVYTAKGGKEVVWREAVRAACDSKLSIPPEAELPRGECPAYAETTVQVVNDSTLSVSKRMVDEGLRPLALNFANGVEPGGGFLTGARAQEEGLCWSSALYLTLKDDPMYAAHRKRPLPDSTDWAIYSPDVPVFRSDGENLLQPWPLSFLTCAAPYAPTVGQPLAGDLLRKRIHRVLAIARAYSHRELVLGAWGCGAFKNDPHRTAKDFRSALEVNFNGAFSRVVFAILDWSPERKFLGPFRDVFRD